MRLACNSVVQHRGFTLIELIAVVVILAVLAGVALSKMFDFGTDAHESADAGVLGGYAAAFNDVYLQHRMSGAPSSQWITDMSQLQSVLESEMIPTGIVITGTGASARLIDQRGNQYELVPETIDEPARLNLVVSAGGGGGGGGGALSPGAVLMMVLVPLAMGGGGRSRRCQ